MSIPLGFKFIDVFALLFFWFAWIVFQYCSTHARWHKRTITYQMNQYRIRWMKNMINRDPVVPDILIQTSLQQGVGFFASTSLIVIGALFAALGSSEQALGILKDFPITTETSIVQWEFKVLMLVLMFVFAFFKFAWSLRLFNYVAILVGAAPAENEACEDRNDYAVRVARLHALGASHFTSGLNAYSYALAAFTWFISPWIFMVATVWVTLVMYRRTFRSKFSRILAGELVTDELGP